MEVPDSGETDPLLLAQKKNCLDCHAVTSKLIGPSFSSIAAMYRGQPTALGALVQKTISGGGGVWGQIPMPANSISANDANLLITWILGL